MAARAGAFALKRARGAPDCPLTEDESPPAYWEAPFDGSRVERRTREERGVQIRMPVHVPREQN